MKPLRMISFILILFLMIEISYAAYAVTAPMDYKAAELLHMNITYKAESAIKAIGIGAGMANGSQPEEAYDSLLDDDDIVFLKEGYVQFNDGTGYDDYEYSEVFALADDSPSIETSLSGSGVDKGYGSDVVMEVTVDSIYYYFRFEDPINVTLATEDNPLELDIFGNHVKITNAGWDGAGNANQIAVQRGKNYFVRTGELIDTGNHTINITEIVEDRVAISIDDQVPEGIDVGNTYTYYEGLEIYVDSVFYKSGAPNASSVKLLVSANAVSVYRNNEEFIGEPEDDEHWRWVLDNLDANTVTLVTGAGTVTGPVIGIKNYFVADDASDSDPVAISTGGCYVLTEGSSSRLCISGLSTYEYITLDVEMVNVDLRDADPDTLGVFDYLSDAPVIKIKSNIEDSLKLDASSLRGGLYYDEINSDKETDTIYLAKNISNGTFDVQPMFEVFYENEDNDIAYAGTYIQPGAAGAGTDFNSSFAYVNYVETKDEDIQFWLSNDANAGGTGYELVISANAEEIPTGDDNITIKFQNSTDNTTTTGIENGGELDRLSDTVNTEEESDLYFNSSILDAPIGLQDADLRTQYGIIIKNPEDNCKDDEVQLLIPGAAVRANVAMTSSGATVDGDTTALPIIEAVRLDSEVSSLFVIPPQSVIIGGPAANKYAAEFMDEKFPTYGEELGWEDGWCHIKTYLVEEAEATVIAGWDVADTKRCVEKFINGSRDFNRVLSSAEVEL